MVLRTLAVAVCTAISNARWGADGHRVIAQVALHLLPPAVTAETRRLLGGQSITDVANWADDIRRTLPTTAPWHYVRMQIGDTSYVAARDCKDDACVIAAVSTQLAILSDMAKPDSTRTTALKYVVHFIGDLHQPLHAGDRADQNGNQVRVTFSGQQFTLHSLWDSELLRSYGETNDALVKSIVSEVSHRTDLAAIRAGSPTSWAKESHDISRDVVYRSLPASLEITPAYAEAARPVIRERLLRGGVRLASVLERALGAK